MSKGEFLIELSVTRRPRQVGIGYLGEDDVSPRPGKRGRGFFYRVRVRAENVISRVRLADLCAEQYVPGKLSSEGETALIEQLISLAIQEASMAPDPVLPPSPGR